ncbi:MAG: hypothetical protein FJ098_04805, partial [Deltaproteobacteria bacterium]|nr:hypothetical protein [Deltaproteobacteria bacterium]
VHYMVNRLHGGVERLARTASLDLEPGEFPEGAADFLEEVRACGGVLNHAPWGGYLLYRLWPCVRVYTDGRGNFSDIETHVLTTIQNPGTRRRAIDASWQRAPFEILVHPLPFPWFDYHRFFWILVYRDETAYVYLRNMPENDPVFARVRDWYAARGVDLSGTRHTDESAVELERRIQRFHGARMLDKPWAQRLLAATVRDASEDTEEARHAALFRRADLYFGLGLHRECQETLALASQLDPRDPSAALLLVRSLVADGQQPRAQLLAHVLLRSIRSDPGVAAKLTGQEIAILNILGAHLGDLLGEPPPAPAPGT